MSCIVYSEEPGYMELTVALYYNHEYVSECCIKCDKVLADHVIGVYASDRIPNHRFKHSYGLIVNTDKHTDPGQHWCTIYNDGHGHIEFFDSYGRPPTENSVLISSWINEISETLNFNNQQLQSNNSAVCGLYCLLYLHQRLNGISLDDFVKIFDSNLNANDEYVVNLRSSAFPECFSNKFVYNRNCCSLSSVL